MVEEWHGHGMLCVNRPLLRESKISDGIPETHHVASRNATQNYQFEQHSVAQQYQVLSH